MRPEQLETLQAAGLLKCVDRKGAKRTYRIAPGAESLFQSVVARTEPIERWLARTAPTPRDRRPAWAWLDHHRGREINYPRLELRKCER